MSGKIQLFQADDLEGLDKFEGFNVDLIKKLQDILGAKFNLNLVKDGKIIIFTRKHYRKQE